MATVNDLVRQAFRQENLKAVSQTISDAEMAEGVEIFNEIWENIIGSTLGEKLNDWPVPPSAAVSQAREFPLLPRDESLPYDTYAYPQQNYNIVSNLGGAQTVYLKQNPSDGARMGLVNIGPSYAVNPLTINANGRLIEGASSLVLDSFTATPIRWFYRADLSEWVRITEFTGTEDSPLPKQFNRFWRCAVAIDLCPRYNKDPQAVTLAGYKDGMATILGRYAQDMPSAVDPDNLWRMPWQAFAYPQAGNFGNG